MPQWLIRLLLALVEPFDPQPEPPPPPPDPQPAPPPAPDPVPRPEPDAPPALAVEINAARATAGLSPLEFDPALGQVSESWARAMAADGALDHGAFGERIASIYPNTAAGEDIAEGQPTAPDVVAAWMDDPPHRANILGGFNRLGVGQARADDGTLYWCADFVQKD